MAEIKENCKCGSIFHVVSNDRTFVEYRYSDFLTAHKICREKPDIPQDEKPKQIARIPGFCGNHLIITDNCREMRGDNDAANFVSNEIRENLIKTLKGWPAKEKTNFHIVITIERAGI